MPVEARRRLWDTVMCAGFDYREVAQGKKDNQGANMWYTKAAGAPDILLHYNYYEPPSADQPPPMGVLCAADAVFREVATLDVGKAILEPDDEDDEDDEGANGGEASEDGTGSECTAAPRGVEDGADGLAPPTKKVAGGSSGFGGGGSSSTTAAGATTAAARARGGAGQSSNASDDGSATDEAKQKKASARPFGALEGKCALNPMCTKGLMHRGACWIDEAAADLAAMEENLAKQKAFEEKRLLWPRRPNFRSVLAIGYKPNDTFRWHTDLAGEEGWVCSLSVGATSTFEYLPTAAPSALRRARARAEGSEVVRVEIASGCVRRPRIRQACLTLVARHSPLPCPALSPMMRHTASDLFSVSFASPVGLQGRGPLQWWALGASRGVRGERDHRPGDGRDVCA